MYFLCGSIRDHWYNYYYIFEMVFFLENRKWKFSDLQNFSANDLFDILEEIPSDNESVHFDYSENSIEENNIMERDLLEEDQDEIEMMEGAAGT